MNNVTNAINNFNSDSVLDLNSLEASALQGCYAAEAGNQLPTYMPLQKPEISHLKLSFFNIVFSGAQPRQFV
jgi:hypothetical protein